MNRSETVIVLVTCPTAESAKKIANSLVQEKLAACVNIIPQVNSIYFWEGKIQDDSELLLLIKTTEDSIAALEKELFKIHPYTTPEFIVLKTQYVAAKYQSWLGEILKR